MIGYHNPNKIGCTAWLEELGNEEYLVNIRAENRDHFELVAYGKNHAGQRLREFLAANPYKLLRCEGFPRHWETTFALESITP